MKQLLWRIRHLPPAVLPAAALALLIAVAVFHFAAVVPLEARLEEAELAAVKNQERVALKVSMQKDQDPELQLEGFYKFFDSGETLPDALAKLYTVAEAQQLHLKQGEYRLFVDKASKLKRYQIAFPVQGGYPAIRKFVAGALAEVPRAALDSVSFERRKIGDPSVDAVIRFTLFLPNK